MLCGELPLTCWPRAKSTGARRFQASSTPGEWCFCRGWRDGARPCLRPSSASKKGTSRRSAMLERVFGNYGLVVQARMARDRYNGVSLGHAMVEMATGADEAIRATDGRTLQGNAIAVREAEQGRLRRAKTAYGNEPKDPLPWWDDEDDYHICRDD